MPGWILLLTWTAATHPSLASYIVRMTQANEWDDGSNSTVATLTPPQTSLSTQDGLPTPGSIATFRVFVLLSDTTEAGSNAVTIQRP